MTKLPLTLRNRGPANPSYQTRPSDSKASAISAPPASTTPLVTSSASDSKSPSNSAMLAQRLASESSWADRYVPATPEGTVMTPSTHSVAGFSDAHLEEEPPTYETATSTSPLNSRSLSGPQPPTTPQQDITPQASSSQDTTIPRPPLFDGNYSRHETSNAINGTFTLRDSLDLSTTSGSISIRLDVKPGAHPAILKLRSQSGSIRVDDRQCDAAQDRSRRKKLSKSSSSFRWGWGKKPDTDSDNTVSPVTTNAALQQQETDTDNNETFTARVIHTTIETSSGSVSGSLILTPGAETHIKTSSGSIGLRLLSTGSGSKTQSLSKLEREYAHAAGRDALADDSLRSALTTTSNSGSQHITVSTSTTDTSDGAIVSAVQAKHYTTGSASLHVHYPQEWCAMVHASVGGSGRCWVRGHGLEYEKRGKSEIYAWRNIDGDPAKVGVEVRSDGSGSIGFHC